MNGLVELGFLLIFIGFILVFLAILLSIMKLGGKVEGGGVVLIGPFPIIFGTNKSIVKIALLIAIIIIMTVIMITILLSI